MTRLNFVSPLNTLSFGQCSYNILKELFKRDIEVAYHPIGKIDISAYDVAQEFHDKLHIAANKKYDLLDAPTLKLWHLNEPSEVRVGRGKSTLFTFHECSQLTNVEKSIANVHDEIIVSSNYTKGVFGRNGVSNVTFAPLGLDEEFKVLDKPHKLLGRTHWGICGKWEKRKNTRKIISEWAKKYGNNNRHQLTCAIINPFLDPEMIRAEINIALEGKKYHNIQFLEPMVKNAEVNVFINSLDIDLSGLSSAEGWGLPSFNSTCLGKWSIVSRCTAHLDWANDDNAIMVEPSGVEVADDGVFFRQGGPFNQGNFYTISEESISEAFTRAESKIGIVNTNGLELGKKLTYQNTVDSLLKVAL